jgi:hypothetical protein
MTDIEHLDSLISGFTNLNFQDNAQRDKLERSTEMILKNLFGSETKYVKDFEEISFYPIVFSNRPDQERNMSAWENGKTKAINLLTVAKEEKLRFGNGKRKKEKNDLSVPSTFRLPWLFKHASIKFWAWAVSYSVALIGCGIGIAQIRSLQGLLKVCDEIITSPAIQTNSLKNDSTTKSLDEEKISLSTAMDEIKNLRDSISRINQLRLNNSFAVPKKEQTISSSPG